MEDIKLQQDIDFFLEECPDGLIIHQASEREHEWVTLTWANVR